MQDIASIESRIRQQIEILGSEWHDMSDARFWNEADARARLLWLLCEAPNLVAEVSDLQCGGKVWKIPLAHAECLGARDRGGLQGAFDIVVFAPDSIQKYVRIRWDPYGWQEEVRRLPVLAAIELKDEGKPWSPNIEKDLDKLLQRMQNDPIQQGYLILLYDAEKYPLLWDDVSRSIKEGRDRYSRKPNVRVYFSPWSRRPVEPKWIDIDSV